MSKLLKRKNFLVTLSAVTLALAPISGAWAQSLAAVVGGSNSVGERQFLPIQRSKSIHGKPIALKQETRNYIPLNANARFSRSSKMIPLAGEKKTLTRLADIRHQVMIPKATETPNELTLAKLDPSVQIATMTPEAVERPWVTAPVKPLFEQNPQLAEKAAQQAALLQQETFTATKNTDTPSATDSAEDDTDETEIVDAAEEHEGIEMLDDVEPSPQGKKHGTVTFYWPLASEDYKGISSPFGTRIHPVTRKKSFHAGIDLPAPTGTEVLAAADGKVTGVGQHPRLGRYVKITHNDGSYSLYGHLSRASTAFGKVVKAGHVIGKVGSTGRSTGPHLDFSVRKDGAPINPIALLPDASTLKKKTLALAK